MFKFPDMLLFPLAGAAMLSAVIMTILNGLAYTTLPTRSLAPAAGLAPVALSAISCVALIMLTFLVHKDVGRGGKLAGWKAAVFYFTVVYLLVAAGSTAGTMATSPDRTSLSITRSVFWAMSIFAQGSYCGYLLIPNGHVPIRKNSRLCRRHQVQSPLPLQSVIPIRSTVSTRGEDRYASSPRRSSRYSGGTLDLDSSKPEYPTETNSMISSLSVSPTNDHKPVPFLDPEQDTRPLLRGTGSIRSMPSLRQDGVRPSLDNLMQPASPVTSIFHTGVSNESVETLAPREHNIHPLFRSTSPSPSPTPTLER
ncbi:hypothetical protein N7470_000762 [Penicillium chermesinum]|nr:hypothetical protein N7470_000762 [Penicillium chermesinum]